MYIRRPFLWLTVTLGAAYAVFGLVIYALQEQAIYFPDPKRAEIQAGWPIEEVTIETPDGERLVAWHMSASTGCPTLLMFHGNAGHIGKAASQYQRINKAGVGMLALAWRGYNGSTGKPTQASLYNDA